MRNSSIMTLTIAVCVVSIVILQVFARPYDEQLSEKDRQDIIRYAAKIIKLVYGPEYSEPEKRNSGMLDAVINMPDLFKAGRK